MRIINTQINHDLEVYASVGGAAFFERLLIEWERRGWRVLRHHALQENEYRASHGFASRLCIRWKMYGQSAWQCWWSGRQGRRGAPLRVVTTNPFFAPALVQWAAQGSGATINLLYDLYPDALIQAGVLDEGSWLAQRCAAITSMALRECAATVFLGERLRCHAELRYGPARKAAVIPVGADGVPFRNLPPQAIDRTQDIKMLYAGQMGRMHEIDTVRQTLREGVPTGLQLVFHASGAGYNLLQRNVFSDVRCKWGGPLGQAEWQQTMSEVHVALVTMAHGAEKIAMPSKTYSALVAGQAILALCPAQSDLADLILKHDCGWVVEPGDVDGLRRALTEITAFRDELQRKRMNAFRAGHAHYDVAVLAKQWIQLFESLTDE